MLSDVGLYSTKLGCTGWTEDVSGNVSGDSDMISNVEKIQSASHRSLPVKSHCESDQATFGEIVGRFKLTSIASPNSVLDSKLFLFACGE